MKWQFNIRSIFLNPEALECISVLFWETHKHHYPFQIAGQEISAIPFVTAISLHGAKIGFPVNGFVIRKKRKDTGLQNILEGDVTKLPVVLIDDLISSGKTFIRQSKLLEQHGLRLLSLFALVDLFPTRTIPELVEKGICWKSVFTAEEFGLYASPPRIRNEVFDVKWHFHAHAQNFFLEYPRTDLAINKNSIFFGADNGVLYALSQSTGEVEWQFSARSRTLNRPSFTTPVLLGETLIISTQDGDIHALAQTTGEKKWSFYGADVIETPALLTDSKKLALFAARIGLFRKRNLIIGISAHDGKIIWNKSFPERIVALITTRKGEAVAAGESGSIFCIQQETGELLWQQNSNEPIAGAIYYKQSMGLFVGTKNGTLSLLNPANGAVIWHQVFNQPLLISPISYTDTVLLVVAGTTLHGVNKDSGKVLWRLDLDSKVLSTLLIREHKVYVGTNDGTLYEVDLKEKKMGFFQAVEQITSRPVHSPQTQCFYVTTAEGVLYSLKRKEA